MQFYSSNPAEYNHVHPGRYVVYLNRFQEILGFSKKFLENPRIC